MRPDLNKKRFKSTKSDGQEVIDIKTIFNFFQEGNILWAEYSGGKISKGYLHGKIINDDHMDFLFNHINSNNEYMTGRCTFQISTERSQIHFETIWSFTNKYFGKIKVQLIEI